MSDSTALCVVVFDDGTRCHRPTRRKAAQWCGPCYDWSLHHGRADPMGRTAHRAKGALQKTLRDAARATTDACIIIDGYRQRPVARMNGVMMAASRVVWIMRHGDPGDAVVRHTCSGGSGALGCVNIRHLVLGDKAQNSRDMAEADRSNHGERCPTAKLTETDVREIRRLLGERIMQKEIGARFGVGQKTISDIATGKTWVRVQ